MKIGIVGLGLIGGSFAKAFHANTEDQVFGYDNDPLAIKLANLTESMDGELSDQTIGECDYIFLSVYPDAAIQYLSDHAVQIKKGAVVIDCCGVKRSVCDACFPLAAENGFHFLGGHPMAGIQFSGFKYSREDLFQNAGMILVPKPDEDIRLLEAVKNLLKKAGFSSVTMTTAEKHDEIIAYTSQLAHIVSNAYVKSPNAQIHKGFSAGSYKDLTRVARLNEFMWTELFMANSDYLVKEVDFIIESLAQYSAALKNKDSASMLALLREGRECKEREEHK